MKPEGRRDGGECRGAALRSLRGLRRGLRWAALGYAVAALWGGLLVPGYEVFPFFSWFLFPLTPTTEVRYELVVTEQGGRRLPEPLTLRHFPPRAEPLPVEAYYLVQSLGEALWRKDPSEVSHVRRLLDGPFLPSSCRYRILRVSGQPMDLLRERWHHSRPLGEFACASFGEGSGSSAPGTKR